MYMYVISNVTGLLWSRKGLWCSTKLYRNLYSQLRHAVVKVILLPGHFPGCNSITDSTQFLAQLLGLATIKLEACHYNQCVIFHQILMLVMTYSCTCMADTSVTCIYILPCANSPFPFMNNWVYQVPCNCYYITLYYTMSETQDTTAFKPVYKIQAVYTDR